MQASSRWHSRARTRRRCVLQDAYGSPLTFSGGRSDTLMLALLRAAYSGGPNNDTHLAASMEQALPLQPDWLNFNRFCVRGEQSVPLFKGLRAHLTGKGAPLHPPYEQAKGGACCCTWTSFTTLLQVTLTASCTYLRVASAGNTGTRVEP